MKKSIFVKLIVNLAGVTVFAVVLSWITLFDMTTLSFFSPTEKNFDFQSSDFYQLVADSRKERKLDTNIVIVPIDGLSRQDVLVLLDDIYQSSPAVVGLDVFFLYPSENDASLDEFIQSHPNLIVPVRMESVEEDLYEIVPAYLYDSLPLDRRGVVNFNIAHPYNTVRDFVFKYETSSGEAYNFAALISKYAEPEAFAYLEQRLAHSGGALVDIDYPSREYTYIDPCDVLLSTEELDGKIVLVGDMANTQDLHVTPVSDTFSGLLVHAHAVSTIIDRDYHLKLPRWGLLLLSIILCLLYVALKTFLNLLGDASDMVMRVIQFLMLLFIILIGSHLYIHHNLLLELSIPLLAIGLVQMALDFWKGCLAIGCVVARKIRLMSIGRKAQK